MSRKIPAGFLTRGTRRIRSANAFSDVKKVRIVQVQRDLRERVKGLDIPLLVITGEHDQPWFSAGALRAEFAAYEKLEVVTCGNAGHYPMQETPVALATMMERFLAKS
jgi:pimeloyl-ACP methyl ester carboxylesterase